MKNFPDQAAKAMGNGPDGSGVGRDGHRLALSIQEKQVVT